MAKEDKPQAGQQKMTYEQLLKVAQDLNTQNNYLKQQAGTMQQKIAELSNFAMFKRLDYLFEVVKNDSKFPKEFVDACINEIVETMTPPPAEQPTGDGDGAKKEE